MEDYNFYLNAIKEISEVYSPRGRNSINTSVFINNEIVRTVVEHYLSRKNRLSSTRIFGKFPEEDVKSLARICVKMEKKRAKFNNSLQQS